MGELIDLDDAAGAPLSHGDLVFMKLEQRLLANLSDAGSAAAGSFPPWMSPVKVWDVGGAPLYVAAVDTEGFNTELIGPRITEAITVLQGAGVQRFVVNMSFAIVPCEPLDLNEYERQLAENYDALSQELTGWLERDPSEAEVRAYFRPIGLVTTFYRPLEQGSALQEAPFVQYLRDDPLLIALSEGLAPETAELIYVAAAGNENYSYPLAPALWEGILSVGATKEITGPDYANDGEVVAHDVVEVPLNDGTEAAVPGTSFAAPDVSLLAAYHLLQGGGASCTEGGVTTTPPLAYATESGPWENQPVRDAATIHCPLFPVTMP
jgi:hypothetical protein